jgi:hypothetical protein
MEPDASQSLRWAAILAQVTYRPLSDPRGTSWPRSVPTKTSLCFAMARPPCVADRTASPTIWRSGTDGRMMKLRQQISSDFRSDGVKDFAV